MLVLGVLTAAPPLPRAYLTGTWNGRSLCSFMPGDAYDTDLRNGWPNGD